VDFESETDRILKAIFEFLLENVDLSGRPAQRTKENAKKK